MADTSAGTPAPDRSPPPGHVELLVAFTNTADHELGTDELDSPEALTRWLAGRGVLRPRTRATAGDLALALQLRDGLHAAMRANHDGTQDWARLDEAAADLPLRVAGAGGRPGLVPVRDGVPGALSRLLVAVQDAVADDTWRRLKICGADDCRWAYFDTTRNRSRAWCEWGCGNKAKTRNYRARRRQAVAQMITEP